MKIGIDYSLSCPGVCINTSTDEFRYEDCKFYYLTTRKKFVGAYKHNGVSFEGTEHKPYSSEPERYENIADWVVDIINSYYPKSMASKKNHTINLEDYSYASKGRVFHIAENMGLLKHKLYLNNWDYSLLAPSVIKKYATGKGNSNKEAMTEQFALDTGLNVLDMFECKYTSPATDVVDAYYICKYQPEISENPILSK
tara:strand:+ start:6979 stop:7572 length:594 start_codon:yes stop_codon:yes gene_type:complete